MQKAMSIEDQSAVHIQRMARGFLGKKRWNFTFETNTKSAMVAQSLLRGFAARRFVWNKIQKRDSSQLIQKMMRGAIARLRVRARREENTRNRAARTAQALFRAFKGKRRMQAKRDLMKVAIEAKAAVDSVFMSDLDELCSIGQGPPEKRKPPLPALLSMIQCVRILWSAGHGPPPGATSAPLRWNRLRRRILRPSFLPRLRSLAQAAVDEVLQISPSRIAAVKVFFNDPNLNLNTMQGLPVGAKAAKKLFTWLMRIVHANELLQQFIGTAEERALAKAAQAKADDDAMHWYNTETMREDSDSSDDEDGGAIDAKRYVPYEVQKCLIVRPRPLVVCLSRDIPSLAKKLMVQKLMEELPGAFTRIDLPELSVASIQSSIDAGHSVLVDCDAGMGAATRRAFLAEIKTIKDALTPTPLMLLLRGDRHNRSGGGTDVGLGAREGLTYMSEADASMKRHLETAMEALYPLQSEDGHKALVHVSERANPSYSDVLVLESLMILLSPDQRFKGPNTTVGAVTWQASCAMLKDPAKLLTRIKLVKADKIPEENFLALQEYVCDARAVHSIAMDVI